MLCLCEAAIRFMHESSNFGALFKFDLEIEPTLHRLKRQRQIQEELEVDISTSMMAGGEDAQRTLWDYATLGPHSQTPSITRPLLTTNNFKLKPALISMVQQS